LREKALLERFIAAWEAGDEPPPLAAYVPPASLERRPILIELIKVDLEYRWQERNVPKRLAEYLTEFPELVEAGIPVDLVHEECHIRRQCGFSADPAEYVEQFPEQAEELRRLLELEQPDESTILQDGTSRSRFGGVQVGQQIGDFDLLLELGAGAFAVVYLARQQSMQRLVALKITEEAGPEPQILAQLDHDHIVRVFDRREDKETGRHLLYMQYIAGGALDAVVKAIRSTPVEDRDGQLLIRVLDEALDSRGETRPIGSSLREKLAAMTWSEVVFWMGARLAEALDYAQQRGVLHCDVKPANVLLTAEGAPKLADFNVSCNTNLAEEAAVENFGGSLVYMSVEQLEACHPSHPRKPADLDGRADLFSLGVLLWELLTGTRPFERIPHQGNWSVTLTEMIEQRQRGISPDAIEQLPADCSPGLVRVLQKCLAGNRDNRWEDGAELAMRFELCLHPQAERIIHPPPESWAARLRSCSTLCVMLLAGIPNILAGVFNLLYNHEEIVKTLGDSQDVFWRTQMVINSIAYPFGLGLLFFLTRSVSGTAKADTNRDRIRRRRCLRLGHYTAWIGALEWTIAGVAYPVSLHFLGVPIPIDGCLHFFGSLVLSGLIAATYPFFGVTYFAFRVLYPSLLRDRLSSWDDGPALRQLETLAWRYLALGTSLPLFAVAALIVRQSDARIALIVLSVGGLFGLIGVFALFRRFVSDLESVAKALGRR
jgi:serine/threonine protein kinase